MRFDPVAFFLCTIGVYEDLFLLGLFDFHRSSLSTQWEGAVIGLENGGLIFSNRSPHPRPQT